MPTACIPCAYLVVLPSSALLPVTGGAALRLTAVPPALQAHWFREADSQKTTQLLAQNGTIQALALQLQEAQDVAQADHDRLKAKVQARDRRLQRANNSLQAKDEELRDMLKRIEAHARQVSSAGAPGLLAGCTAWHDI